MKPPTDWDELRDFCCNYPLDAATEIDRLRAENAEFRAQFKDADEIAAEFARWEDFPASTPDGWTPVPLAGIEPATEPL